MEKYTEYYCFSPQRNERRGWMGDAALTVNEALYNFDLVKFYVNFLNLITDVQLADGQVPDFVPGNSATTPIQIGEPRYQQ